MSESGDESELSAARHGETSDSHLGFQIERLEQGVGAFGIPLWIEVSDEAQELSDGQFGIVPGMLGHVAGAKPDLHLRKMRFHAEDFDEPTVGPGESPE